MWESSVGVEEQVVLEALRSGRIGTEAEVDAFEGELASTYHCHVVTTSSGSMAIELVLRTQQIGRGDTVLIPALTCRSVVDAVRATGAQPGFVDVDERRLTIDPAGVAARLDGGVRAIVAVDQYGCEASVAALRKLARPRDVVIVHDTAASFGLATVRPAPGVVRVASLHASKPFSVGEGGLVLTADAALADRVRYLRSPGALAVRGARPPLGWEESPGFSARMSDLDAALARARFPRLPAMLRSRKAVANAYTRSLAPLGRRRVLLPPSRRHAFASYAVQLLDATAKARVVALASAQGLALDRGHGALHDHRRDSCPTAQRVADRTVCLPTSTDDHTDSLAAVIVDAVR